MVKADTAPFHEKGQVKLISHTHVVKKAGIVYTDNKKTIYFRQGRAPYE